MKKKKKKRFLTVSTFPLLFLLGSFRLTIDMLNILMVFSQMLLQDHTGIQQLDRYVGFREEAKEVPSWNQTR